mmetsp:Transcript_5018/g.12610  ORF Transcript_5018/g.12610 Transcript_5018/m.12610 type:complete len:225 (+) Transcript_5018:79-753(+)
MYYTTSEFIVFGLPQPPQPTAFFFFFFFFKSLVSSHTISFAQAAAVRTRTTSPTTGSRKSASCSWLIASRTSCTLRSAAPGSSARRAAFSCSSSCRTVTPTPTPPRRLRIVLAISCCCLRAAALTPVWIKSMSIVPVRGSVALCCRATCISRLASCTSDRSTVPLRRMRARDSLSRIRASSCRGVAVTTLRFRPSWRISTYAFTSSSSASSLMHGCTFVRAWLM